MNGLNGGDGRTIGGTNAEEKPGGRDRAEALMWLWRVLQVPHPGHDGIVSEGWRGPWWAGDRHSSGGILIPFSENVLVLLRGVGFAGVKGGGHQRLATASVVPL